MFRQPKDAKAHALSKQLIKQIHKQYTRKELLLDIGAFTNELELQLPALLKSVKNLNNPESRNTRNYIAALECLDCITRFKDAYDRSEESDSKNNENIIRFYRKLRTQCVELEKLKTSAAKNLFTKSDIFHDLVNRFVNDLARYIDHDPELKARVKTIFAPT